MSKAYECDICKKLTPSAHQVSGLDFKIGVWKDSIMGTHDRMNEVKDVCPECYDRILTTIKELYEQSQINKNSR